VALIAPAPAPGQASICSPAHAGAMSANTFVSLRAALIIVLPDPERAMEPLDFEGKKSS
jgi:hypothetical protein